MCFGNCYGSGAIVLLCILLKVGFGTCLVSLTCVEIVCSNVSSMSAASARIPCQVIDPIRRVRAPECFQPIQYLSRLFEFALDSLYIFTINAKRLPVRRRSIFPWL